jgi:hypothetical protein
MENTTEVRSYGNEPILETSNYIVFNCFRLEAEGMDQIVPVPYKTVCSPEHYKQLVAFGQYDLDLIETEIEGLYTIAKDHFLKETSYRTIKTIAMTGEKVRSNTHSTHGVKVDVTPPKGYKWAKTNQEITLIVPDSVSVGEKVVFNPYCMGQTCLTRRFASSLEM